MNSGILFLAYTFPIACLVVPVLCKAMSRAGMGCKVLVGFWVVSALTLAAIWMGGYEF